VIALCPPSVAWTTKTHIPVGSVLRIVYCPVYAPPAVLVRAIAAPVGVVAVTAAPETGTALKVTSVVIEAASPRLKTALEIGVLMKTERPCEEVVVKVITWTPLPAFPCVSEAEVVTTWDPVWSVDSTKYEPVQAASEDE
jgi:hypothetical protein